MFSDLQPLYPLLVPFLLVLFRMIGLVVFVPFFSNSSVPGNVRVLLALAITFCVWNVVPALHQAGGVGITIPETMPSLVIAVAGEMSVGLLIGLMLGAVFTGIQLGSHMISQQMGLSTASIYDPTFEEQSTVIEQVAFWIALVAFLSAGGHRQIVHALVYSYAAVPMGAGGVDPQKMLDILCGAMEASFNAATRVAMPGLVAFFVSTITGGLMSRAMPQLNFMSVGIPMNIIIGFIMVMFGMTGWALVSTQSFSQMFEMLARLLG